MGTEFPRAEQSTGIVQGLAPGLVLSLYRCWFVLHLQVENEVMPDSSCRGGAGRSRPGDALAKGSKWISTYGLHLCSRV